MDAVAAELIAARAALAVVVSPHDAPALFQYGAPAATVVEPAGALERPATLAALTAAGQARSLQGQLLTAGLEARALPIGVLREEGLAELAWVLGALGHEECDDGNAVDGDGCGTNCTWTRCGKTAS